MNIYVSGVNYKTTPLEIREKLSFDADEGQKLLDEVIKLQHVSECVFLSTCNRTEVYIYSDSSSFSIEEAENLICKIKGVNVYDIRKYFYFYNGLKAVKHLFNVACGLDSMVLGEDQILGQVKDAHGLSLERGTSSAVLNTLFREAVTTAKKVKTNTELSKNSVSVGSQAVKLLLDLFDGQLDDKTALIIGMGKMGSITLKNLCARGIGKVFITNRTHGKASDFTETFSNIAIVDYDRRYSVMEQCDIVISSTSSPHYTITADMLEKSIKSVRRRVFVDLAVPRDMDTDIRKLAGVMYYNMDDLQVAVDKNMDIRQIEASKAEDIISTALVEFERWYETRGILPVIRDIQKYIGGMVEAKVEHTLSKLKSTCEDDREAVKAAISGTAASILNLFVYSVRDYAGKEDIEAYFRCLDSVLSKQR